MLTASQPTRGQFASAADPIIQKSAPRMVFGSALASATMIAALANAPTITPATSKVRRSALAPRAPTRLTASATSTAATEPTNAANVTAKSAVNPSAKTITAPTAAPPDTPSRYGSASGFRSDPWSAAPLAPSPAPTSAPSITRGSLKSRTMAMTVGSPRPRRASNTAASGTDTDPRATAIAAIANRAAASSSQYHPLKRVNAGRPGGA